VRALRLLLLPLVLPAAAATGCGGSAPAPAARPPVALQVSSPSDVSRTTGATATVAGTVGTAGARVVVLGRRVAVSGGRFSTTVPLQEGPNLIDVAAVAPRAQAAWRVVRVTRRSTITVPDVVGRTLDDATATLEADGLDVQAVDGGGFFDALRGGPRHACATSPAAGADVAPGTRVEVTAAKRC
jgi:serine/threonine-protein kinase